MNRSVEAFLRGYVIFAVNGAKYLTYNRALLAKEKLNGDVCFAGFHVVKGWRVFYWRRGISNSISWVGPACWEEGR